MKRPFVFATGGTGGHIFPALAIAEELHAPVIFAGHNLEQNDYLKEGIHEVVSIPSALPTSLRGLVSIGKGIFHALRYLRKSNPLAVVGFGSYHSFPLLVAASLLRIPVVLFEPNASIGKVNKAFLKRAQLVLSQFPTIPGGYQVTMPIKHFKKIPQVDAKKHYGFDPQRDVVLVMGGSQGAKIFETLTFPEDIQVLHLGGKHSDCEALRRKYLLQGIDAKVVEFEDAMYLAWSAADYAVCRSGALTVAEQIAYKVPTLFIPFPYSSGEHQLHNAEYAAEKMQSGLVLQQSNIGSFSESFLQLKALKSEMILTPKGFPSVASCIERYHFIGAGGIGMSGLIHILRDLKIAVSGSDIKQTAMTRALEAKGAIISTPQHEKNVPPFARVIYSTAIAKNNPEWKAASKKKLPLLHRSELLASLCDEKHPLLVTGTHGKTSTTALLAYTLKEANLFPMYAVGGILKNYGKNGEWGEGVYAAIEADESDGSFLNLPCHSALITNIEADHLDYYGDEQKMLSAYRAFISKVRHHLVWCVDGPILQELSPHGVSYGFSHDADVRIVSCEDDGVLSRFTIEWESEVQSSFVLPQVGTHCVSNATAVLVLLKLLGFDPEEMASTWRNFKGVGRRLEFVGNAKEIDVYDDYAHHPTEVLATLKALRKKVGARRIVSVFQPHRYTRFKKLAPHFAETLKEADDVIITDIYAAGEQPLEHVDPNMLLTLLANSKYFERKTLARKLLEYLRKGDVLVTLGAGDITQIGKEVLQLLSHE